MINYSRATEKTFGRSAEAQLKITIKFYLFYSI